MTPTTQPLTVEEIEQEIQARIEFKMNEFMTGIKNMCKVNWHIAFKQMSQKHQYYWEAFEQIQEMFDKEVRMAPPCNDMAKRRKWEAKEKAVENIIKLIDMRGHRDYHHKISSIAREVEAAQNY